MTSPDFVASSLKIKPKKTDAWFDRLFNNIFALEHNAGLLRKLIIQISFIILWILWTISLYPVDSWKEMIGTFFQNLLATKQWSYISPLQIIISFCFKTFFHPEVIRHLLILYVPFWLARRINSIFLSDIFSNTPRISDRFLKKAAFGLSGVIKNSRKANRSILGHKVMDSDANTIRIREGKVLENDQNLSVLLIGGPGYIEVELDSAALIETPDGTCKVVGPTVKSGVEIIEGFDRIRQGVNLRDIIDSQNVTARSRDGILVNAKDIQYSFSVYRSDQNKKSIKTPYPFDPEAVKRLVYHSVRDIQTNRVSDTKHDWMTAQPGKITANIGEELASFIKLKGLSEFLAAIGTPEIENLRDGEKHVGHESKPEVSLDNNADIPSPSEKSTYTPRTLITKMFMEGSKFKESLKYRGVQLNWLGVGTWDTPIKKIPANHIEAWKISRENLKRGNPEELKKIQDEAKLSELLRLVQITPINTFFDLHDKSDQEVVDRLLADYHEILVEAKKLHLQDNQEIPVDLSRSIAKLNSLRDVHWVNE